jgi:hypothetical protein
VRDAIGSGRGRRYGPIYDLKKVEDAEAKKHKTQVKGPKCGASHPMKGPKCGASPRIR